MPEETAEEKSIREALGIARRRMLEALQTKGKLNIDDVKLDLSKFETLQNKELEQNLNDYLTLRLARETLSRGFMQESWNSTMARLSLVSIVVASVALLVSVVALVHT